MFWFFVCVGVGGGWGGDGVGGEHTQFHLRFRHAYHETKYQFRIPGQVGAEISKNLLVEKHKCNNNNNNNNK